MREQTSSQPFEPRMASNTSRYCSQFDFPEYLGTGVDVNPDRLRSRRPTAGECFFASSSSVWRSSTSLCSWITAISNSIFGEHSLSVPPSSCLVPDISFSLYFRRPICVALRNVTIRRRTIRPVGRSQCTLPWDIPQTVSVCNRLCMYPINGWPTSRFTFAARRLFCPLSE